MTTPRRPHGWLARALYLATAGLATVTLMACYGGPSVIDDCVDQDGDGWFPACYDEPCDPRVDPYCDCDDHDPATHPGAYDQLGDGIDRDCSGADGPPKCEEPDCYPDAEPSPDAVPPPDAPPPDGAPPPDATAVPDAV